ncbi:MAG: DUF4258 domain-containing protein [Dehalococcoidia bacterium]
MSSLFKEIQYLIVAGDVVISEHGYDELAEDRLTVREVLDGVGSGAVIEEYPNYPKGRCILLLQQARSGNPIHVVWGIPKGHDKPVVMVTAYRPDPERWDESFLRRR